MGCTVDLIVRSAVASRQPIYCGSPFQKDARWAGFNAHPPLLYSAAASPPSLS